MFIVIGQDTIWQWVGKELIAGNQAAYQDAAQHQIELLQKHEKAPQKVVTVYQGREDPNFWKCLNVPGPPKDAYRPIADWSYLYIDLQAAKAKGPVRHTVIKQMDEYKDEVEEE